MPLRSGNSAAIKSQNISEFHTGKTYAHTKAKFGKKRADAQAIAVALSTARKYRRRADGGSDDQGSGVVANGGLDQGKPPVSGQSPPSVGGQSEGAHIDSGLRQRAISTALDWLGQYGQHLGGANELGFDPSDKEAMAGFTKALSLNPVVGAYRGVAGLVDASQAQINAEKEIAHTPMSEEDFYLAQKQKEQIDKDLAGQSLLAGLGASGVRGISPGEAGTLGALGSKPPPAGKFFHPYDLDPAELKGAKQLTEAKGSNPGGTYELSSGEPVYIKTPPTPDHAYNEKLAAELYKLAGVPVADVKMTKFGGKPSIVSPIIPGKVLKDTDAWMSGTTSDLGEHHPADLWLGNYDWVGTGKDNVIIDPTGRAHRIDTGGALRYRAQGALKGPDMWGPEVKPFDLSKSPDMADVMDFTPKKWEQPTAQRVSQITDDQIKGLVDKYGPLAKGEKEKLFETLKARRDGVAKMYGVGDKAPPETPPQPHIGPEDIQPGMAPSQPQTLGQKFKAMAAGLNDKLQNSKLNQSLNNLSDKLTGNTPEAVAKAAQGKQPPQPLGQDQFKQVPSDQGDAIAKSQADILMENPNPAKMAKLLWDYANTPTVGAAKADAIVKHLPQEMWADIDAHLSEISSQKGHDPWQKAADEHTEYADWGDDPDHPASEPMAPEGWGNDHGSMGYEGDFKFTDEPHWWDDLGKYGTIHTPEKPPGGWTEGALSHAFKDKRFARAMTPEEWQNYKPPTTGTKFPIPPQADEVFLQKARALGANTNFVIAKGFSKYYAKKNGNKFESTPHGYEYPKEIENPKSKSHGYTDEPANYFADSPQVANSYGSNLSAPYFVIARNPLEVYYPAFKRATTSKTAEHILGDGAEYSGNVFTQMIHAAHKNGHDWLILHGVNDSGGANHTQYLMLNHKGTVRGVGADLDPAKKWSPRPLDALVAAPVGYGAWKAMNQKDDEQ